MRASLLLALAFPFALAACPPPVENLIDCRAAWVCGDQETAEQDDGGEDICLDPNDLGHDDKVAAQQARVQNDCEEVPVGCVGGAAAVCTATCTVTTTPCGPDAGA